MIWNKIGRGLESIYQKIVGGDKGFNKRVDKKDQLPSSDLMVNVKYLKQAFINCNDVVLKIISTGQKKQIALIYTEGLIVKQQLTEGVLGPLRNQRSKIQKKSGQDLLKFLREIVNIGEIHEVKEVDKLVTAVLGGFAVLLVDGSHRALLLNLRSFPSRMIEDSIVESIVRGPRDAFVESIDTNISLVRKRLRTADFKLLPLHIGERTKTLVSVGYIKGVARDDLVQEAMDRLKRIKIDGVLESHYLQELIEDNPRSIFPQLLFTERPDKVTAGLLEGRVAIFVDNTPTVLLGPSIFFDFLQAGDDYNERYWSASAIRLLRHTTFFISIYLPGFWIAVVTFHQEMFPTQLLFSIAAQREGVPFPILVETLLMELAFEFLREAGLRLPRPFGQAVSIVGALIIGDASVRAGFVSPVLVIIVAATGIASFAIPSFSLSLSVRLLRFFVLFAGGIFGLYGVFLAFMVITVHLCTLRSFGVPYYPPLYPLSIPGWKDQFIRAPKWMLKERPEVLLPLESVRQEDNLRPGPYRGSFSEKSRKRWDRG